MLKCIAGAARLERKAKIKRGQRGGKNDERRRAGVAQPKRGVDSLQDVPLNTPDPESQPRTEGKGSEGVAVGQHVAGVKDRKSRRMREKRKQLRALKAEDKLRNEWLKEEKVLEDAGQGKMCS